MFEQPKSEERLFFDCFVSVKLYVKAWGWTPNIVCQRVLMKHLHWAGILWKLANSECFAAGLPCAIDIFGSGHNDEIVHVQLIPQITWHGTEFACSMCYLFYCGGDGLWKVHILWGVLMIGWGQSAIERFTVWTIDLQEATDCDRQALWKLLPRFESSPIELGLNNLGCPLARNSQ